MEQRYWQQLRRPPGATKTDGTTPSPSRSSTTSDSSQSTHSKGSPLPHHATRAGPRACGSSAPPTDSDPRPATNGGSPSNDAPLTPLASPPSTRSATAPKPRFTRVKTSTGVTPPPTPAAPEENENDPTMVG